MNIGQDIDYEMARLRKKAWRLDAMFFIPKTNFSIGMDNIWGLVPVIGDFISMAKSLLMIRKARQLGATNGTIAYMIGNLLVDATIGSIPLIGDIFDIWYNSNIRNYRALEMDLNKRTARAKTVRTVPNDMMAA